MVLDVNDKLYKIQVKTASLIENQKGIYISTCSYGRNRDGNNKKTYTPKEVDFFSTFYNNQCYLIPIELCLSTGRTLYFERESNATILCLKDYKAEDVIQKLKKCEEIIVVYKPIKQYDLQGNLIAEYVTTTEAAKTVRPETTNPRGDAGHISAAINGSRKTAYGYIWKREEK